MMRAILNLPTTIAQVRFTRMYFQCKTLEDEVRLIEEIDRFYLQRANALANFHPFTVTVDESGVVHRAA